MSSVEEPPTTGDETVDEALRQVARLGDLPLEDHADVLRAAHDALDTLLRRDAS
ncbi:MAG: hypothetical protein FWD75_08800 [Propionibacteriaceae bacterium]|nr:hypothetical protein [Propionibacteriaceae bacterium]